MMDFKYRSYSLLRHRLNLNRFHAILAKLFINSLAIH